MHITGKSKIFSALAVCLLIVLTVLTNFLAQNTQPASSPTPSPSPSASASPSPRRTPSPTPLPGAQNFHQWGSITVFNGLPSDSVRAIAQTLDGVMWFGTDNGLARFDGRRVQNFSLGEADSNRILDLKTAAAGHLWIGTEKGAFIYSDGKFLPIEGTQNLGVTAVLLGQEIYLGTDTGHVLRVKPGEGGAFIVESMYPNAILSSEGTPLRITSLIEKDDNLLAGTSGRGVFVVENDSVRELPATPRPLFVNSIANGDNDALWLGTDAAKGLSGIYQIDDGSRTTRITAPTANVLALESN